MIEINRVLIQLEKAITCANSTYPQEKGIAVILFDNLVEVQLYKRTEKMFFWDSYNAKRFYDSKTRNKALSYYQNLLKFTKDNELINKSDYKILNYAHSIRNSVYHKGDLKELDIDLSILLYYDFIKRFFVKWRDPHLLICHSNSPGYQKIDFGQGLSDEPFYDHESYFNSSFNFILNKLNITEKNYLSKYKIF